MKPDPLKSSLWPVSHYSDVFELLYNLTTKPIITNHTIICVQGTKSWKIKEINNHYVLDPWESWRWRRRKRQRWQDFRPGPATPMWRHLWPFWTNSERKWRTWESPNKTLSLLVNLWCPLALDLELVSTLIMSTCDWSIWSWSWFLLVNAEIDLDSNGQYWADLDS